MDRIFYRQIAGTIQVGSVTLDPASPPRPKGLEKDK